MFSDVANTPQPLPNEYGSIQAETMRVSSPSSQHEDSLHSQIVSDRVMELNKAGYYHLNQLPEKGFIHHNDLASQGFYQQHQLEELGYIHKNQLKSSGYFPSSELHRLGFHHKADIRKRLLNAEVITAARGKANPAESYCYVGEHILKNTMDLCSDSNSEDLEKLFNGLMSTWAKTIKKTMAQIVFEKQSSKEPQATTAPRSQRDSERSPSRGRHDNRQSNNSRRNYPALNGKSQRDSVRSRSRSRHEEQPKNDARRVYSSNKGSSSSSSSHRSRKSDHSSGSKKNYDSDHGKQRSKGK